MSSDLWTEASVDVEAEHAQLGLTRAKVAVSSLWPFLAMARTPGEFEHRLALAADSVAERVPVELFDPVVASLREDFTTLRATAKDAEGEEVADDEDGDGKPDWLQEKIDGKKESSLQVTAFYDQGQGVWVKVAVDENAGKGNPGYFVGGPEAGPATGETNQFPTFPLGNTGDPWSPLNEQYPAQPQPWMVPPGGEWKEFPMNFSPPGGGYHPTASRLPFVLARDTAPVGTTDTCANCVNPMRKVKTEWGSTWTHTGKNGAEADDQCPGVPRKNAARRTAQEGVVPTPGPNPNYFAGGGEGIAGDQQGGFPPDVSLPEDVNDWMVDQYGAVPPQRSTGTTGARYTATEENPAPDSEANLGTDFASPQERSRYENDSPDQGSRDSTSLTGARRHAFYDPSDPDVRMVHSAAEENPFATDTGAGAGMDAAAPSPPPSMEIGGPGATAGDPMDPGPVNGGVPQTTKPRQMPGGGAPTGQMMAFRRMGDGTSRERPTTANPFGTDDPFDAKTWDNAGKQRPMVGLEHMNFNGPQNPMAREPIRTVQSPGHAGEPREDEDED